jgi:hypothetical protein
MKKYFAEQYDDEKVLLVFRKHPVVMRKGLVLSSFGLLAGMIPVYIKPEMSYFVGGIIAGCFLSMLLFFPYWLSWFFSVFIITDQRFIQVSQKGMFNKSMVDVSLRQIQMINYQVEGIQETLLGFGTLIVKTFMGDLIINDVHHPPKIQKQILEILKSNVDISTESATLSSARGE